jgi:16S rRNA (uracil1498-N3)-methyltransferase
MAMRIYQAVPLAVGMLPLEEKASHHLARVLRVNINDDIILFNGEGGEYPAVIRSISKKTVIVEVLSFSPREAESPTALYLGQGIARGEKMDFVIQKAVELGVTKIFPLITERCNVRLDSEREQKRMLHWQAVVISACEQSGRNHLPELHAPLVLSDWLVIVNADKKFVLSPHVTAKLDKQHKPASVAVLIGPEGGLSAAEMSAAAAHDFTGLNLGPRVLRTETAALTALAVLQFAFGDF